MGAGSTSSAGFGKGGSVAFGAIGSTALGATDSRALGAGDSEISGAGGTGGASSGVVRGDSGGGGSSAGLAAGSTRDGAGLGGSGFRFSGGAGGTSEVAALARAGTGLDGSPLVWTTAGEALIPSGDDTSLGHSAEARVGTPPDETSDADGATGFGRSGFGKGAAFRSFSRPASAVSGVCANGRESLRAEALIDSLAPETFRSTFP